MFISLCTVWHLRFFLNSASCYALVMLVMLLLCLICSCYASASLWCFYLPHSASLILWLQLDVLCAPPMFTKLGLVTVGPCCLLVVVVGVVVVAISCWHLILVLPVLVLAATYISNYEGTEGYSASHLSLLGHRSTLKRVLSRDSFTLCNCCYLGGFSPKLWSDW